MNNNNNSGGNAYVPLNVNGPDKHRPSHYTPLSPPSSLQTPALPPPSSLGVSSLPSINAAPIGLFYVLFIVCFCLIIKILDSLPGGAFILKI